MRPHPSCSAMAFSRSRSAWAGQDIFNHIDHVADIERAVAVNFGFFVAGWLRALGLTEEIVDHEYDIRYIDFISPVIVYISTNSYTAVLTSITAAVTVAVILTRVAYSGAVVLSFTMTVVIQVSSSSLGLVDVISIPQALQAGDCRPCKSAFTRVPLTKGAPSARRRPRSLRASGYRTAGARNGSRQPVWGKRLAHR